MVATRVDNDLLGSGRVGESLPPRPPERPLIPEPTTFMVWSVGAWSNRCDLATQTSVIREHESTRIPSRRAFYLRDGFYPTTGMNIPEES